MKINAVFFSPTHGTRYITENLIKVMQTELPVTRINMFDLTLPGGRLGNAPIFTEDDFLVLALPVYGGRAPLLIMNNLAALQSHGAKAVIIAVYGNRAYEDALLEMKDIATANGFKVVAAGAFIAEHSLSRRVGAGRPDTFDISKVRLFATDAAAKIAAENADEVRIPGNFPYRERNKTVNIAPQTSSACYGCMVCIYNCPTGAIDLHDPHKVDGSLCIRCCACVKTCPVEAKKFDTPAIVERIAMLEEKFMKRQEPETFL